MPTTASAARSTSDSRANSPVVDAYLEAALQAGHVPNADFNGAAQTGIGRHQLTQYNGLRWSTAMPTCGPRWTGRTSRSSPAPWRTRVMFESGRATGAQISSGDTGGETQVIQADREVIVSAGAYGSPQLLLSGVGPAADLGSFGIPVAADLPVGHGLQDHPLSPVNYLTDEESLITAMSPANVSLLQEARVGPLTCNIDEGGGFMPTGPGLGGPDNQFHSGPVMFFGEGLGVPRVEGWSSR